MNTWWQSPPHQHSALLCLPCKPRTMASSFVSEFDYLSLGSCVDNEIASCICSHHDIVCSFDSCSPTTLPPHLNPPRHSTCLASCIASGIANSVHSVDQGFTISAVTAVSPTTLPTLPQQPRYCLPIICGTMGCSLLYYGVKVQF